MKDVAYLLHGRSYEPDSDLDTYFREAASRDRAELDRGRRRCPRDGMAIAVSIARLDFCRFLAGWRPSSWQRDRRGQDYVRSELGRLTRG